MTLDEAREVLESAVWAHETPLIALLNEIIERHDAPTTDAAGKMRPGAISQVFAGYKPGQIASGYVVQLLIGLRQRYKMPLYAVQD